MIRFALFLSLLLSSAALAYADAPGPARQAQLTHLVRQDCGSCHGMTLKGGLGRPLLPGSLKDFDTEGLVGIIMDGIPGTPMPPWRGLLNEDEALWIVENLKAGTLK